MRASLYSATFASGYRSEPRPWYPFLCYVRRELHGGESFPPNRDRIVKATRV